MKDRDTPIVDLPTLRRDLYLVVSLLLADGKVAEVEDIDVWTNAFHETEVRRLMLWVATAIRGLLDLLNKEDDDVSERHCGEYRADFPFGKEAMLTFRQACNSVIHAKEILPYKAPEREAEKIDRNVYSDRMTVSGDHRGKRTRALLDIIVFAQTADILINLLQENDRVNYQNDRANYQKYLQVPLQAGQ